MFEQQLHFRWIASSPHERRCAQRIMSVRIGAMIEQEFHYPRACMQSRLHERCDTLLTPAVRIPTVREQ